MQYIRAGLIAVSPKGSFRGRKKYIGNESTLGLPVGEGGGANSSCPRAQQIFITALWYIVHMLTFFYTLLLQLFIIIIIILAYMCNWYYVTASPPCFFSSSFICMKHKRSSLFALLLFSCKMEIVVFTKYFFFAYNVCAVFPTLVVVNDAIQRILVSQKNRRALARLWVCCPVDCWAENAKFHCTQWYSYARMYMMLVFVKAKLSRVLFFIISYSFIWNFFHFWLHKIYRDHFNMCRIFSIFLLFVDLYINRILS